MAKRKSTPKDDPALLEDQHVEEVDFYNAFKQTYYDYGMDVIEDRALPDVRDGLKPVHRAILNEMLTKHYTSKHKEVKVAKIIGSVIGTWHPHGDVAAADALANMAAPWLHTMPSIEIKGNGGSVYGDPHAAMRYIEARLTPTGDAYGHRLKQGTVPYVENFNNDAMMPTVLPAQLPYLLINGDSGIAVGVATSIPTHNPIEVINAFLSYVKNPKQSVDDLMQIMPGPDFPTYGEIINRSELPDIYKNGFGKIRVRGRLRYNKAKHSLHVYEIPFTAAGAMNNLVDEITNASMESIGKNGKKVPPKIDGISSVADNSGKDGIDIAIKLKRGVDPDAMTRELFAKTKLETTLTFNFSALNDHTLHRYSLLTYFKQYLAFQHEILINEATTAKDENEKQLEIIYGMIRLQDVINEVVNSAKNANNKAELKDVLQTGKILPGVDPKYHAAIKKFDFTPLQADHIANLPIYKINKMDMATLTGQIDNCKTKIEDATSTIEDATKRKRMIIKEHKLELKKLDPTEFARKTDIIDDDISTTSKLEVPESPLYVNMDKYQYLRIEEKPFENSIETTNKSRLGFFDQTGTCWNLHLETTQPTTGNGTLINQLVPQLHELTGWSTTINRPTTDTEPNLGLFIYADGNVKLTLTSDFMTKTKATKVAGGKSDVPLLVYKDIPNDTLGVTINGKTFTKDALQTIIQGKSGHGKSLLTLDPEADHIDVTFINDADTLAATNPIKNISTSAASQDGSGAVYFAADGVLSFDWSIDQPDSETQPDGTLFAISYTELLNTSLLFIHNDGTAKIVNGEQFKVATKRTKVQADKKGTPSIYIGPIPETMVGLYTDGTQKRIKTDLISTQSKLGGGVRAFYSAKHTLQNVTDGTESNLDCVSLATQPKKP